MHICDNYGDHYFHEKRGQIYKIEKQKKKIHLL